MGNHSILQKARRHPSFVILVLPHHRRVSFVGESGACGRGHVNVAGVVSDGMLQRLRFII